MPVAGYSRKGLGDIAAAKGSFRATFWGLDDSYLVRINLSFRVWRSR